MKLPLTGQLAAQLRDALADGRLAAGERLPSTRALAATLGVSRTVVTVAYTQLFAEGWLEGRHGSGTYVAQGAAGPLPAATATAAPPQAPWVQPGPAPAVNLCPGIPWQAGIDQAAWRRAWRHAGTEPVPAQPDPRGHGALREALTGYLRRSRGVCATADQILVTRGVSAGLGLVAAALLRPGDRVGVEEPGYQAARAVFASRGARLVPCRVDRDGLVVDELSGELERHVRRMRHEYARRRAVMVAALDGLTGDTAGMHMVLELPPGSAAAVAAAASERGVEVATLDRYFAGPPAREGLVLGYGAADLAAVSRGCQVIAETLAGVPGARGAGVPRRPPGGPVSSSISMAPGPAPLHPGTWEAPKWPPRAQLRRR